MKTVINVISIIETLNFIVEMAEDFPDGMAVEAEEALDSYREVQSIIDLIEDAQRILSDYGYPNLFEEE